MKKSVLMLVLLLSFSAMAGPRVTGNGGGGIHRNGIYKTFYSSGVLISPVEETDIPGMSLLTDTIVSITSNEKIFPSYIPSSVRKYYNIIESDVNKENIERLLAEYKRAVKQPQEDLAIFAITEIETKTTFLLPSFYQLTETEQAAILFHEAYWILNPKASYEEVISAEVALQNYLEKEAQGTYSSHFPRLLGKLVGDIAIPLRAALNFDIKNNTEPTLINEKGISTTDLFPETHCQVNSNFKDRVIDEKFRTKRTVYSFVAAYSTCAEMSKKTAQLFYINLEKKYSKSQTAKELKNAFLSNDYLQLERMFESFNFHHVKGIASSLGINDMENMSIEQVNKLKEKITNISRVNSFSSRSNSIYAVIN